MLEKEGEYGRGLSDQNGLNAILEQVLVPLIKSLSHRIHF